MKQEPRVFISHAWEDKQTVRRVERKLLDAGVEVWVDHAKTRAGDNLPKRISDALEWCTTLLLLWSKDAKISRWVEEEWTNAYSLEKKIIPCLLDEEQLPAILHNLLYIKFHDFDNSVRQLFSALKVQSIAPAQTPQIPAETLTAPEPPPAKIALFRAQARTLTDADVKAMIDKYDFYCGEYDWTEEFKNPGGKGFDNDFELLERQGEKLVIDHASGLTWQQSGSEESLTYAKAEAHVKDLNRNAFAGYRGWRLPTLEEAMSLMEPEQNKNGLYIDPVFDAKQSWIWTADKASSGAWNVNFTSGNCNRPFLYIDNFVRAVR